MLCAFGALLSVLSTYFSIGFIFACNSTTRSPAAFGASTASKAGREAALRIVSHQSVPDAIVCANDLIAIGAMQALREHHVRVPRDVAVTGFDDTLLAVASQPQLTTVRQPLHDLGREAVAALRAAIADPSLPPRSATLQADLVVRESSLRARP